MPRITTRYHPKSNGLPEGFNKTLADMLSMNFDIEKKNSDKILPLINFAYNTVKQETTGFTHFYFLYGREAETILDTAIPYSVHYSENDYVRRLTTHAEDKSWADIFNNFLY